MARKTNHFDNGMKHKKKNIFWKRLQNLNSILQASTGQEREELKVFLPTTEVEKGMLYVKNVHSLHRHSSHTMLSLKGKNYNTDTTSSRKAWLFFAQKKLAHSSQEHDPYVKTRSFVTQNMLDTRRHYRIYYKKSCLTVSVQNIHNVIESAKLHSFLPKSLSSYARCRIDIRVRVI